MDQPEPPEGEPEEESPDEEHTALPVLFAQVLGGLAGGVAGLAAGPVGSIGGAAVGQGLAQAAAERVVAHRHANANRAIEYAAESADMSGPELVEQLTNDPVRLQLLGLVLDAATTAIAEDKLRALGAALASGALPVDDAQLSVDFQMVRALSDIEAPHLRVLDYLYPRPEGRNNWWPNRPRHTQALGYSTNTLKQSNVSAKRFGKGLPELAIGMDGLLGILQAHGLVELRGGDWSKAVQGAGALKSRRPDKPDELWFITEWGCNFYERVLAASSEARTGEGADASPTSD